jgi:flagellar hook protein FlgE
MMEAMGAAISGLEAQQTLLNTTANNLANVNTIGYKSQTTVFADELSQTLAGGSSATANNGGSNPKQVGLGVQVGAIENNMGQGSTQTTGNTYDVMIQGNGYFQVAGSTDLTGGTDAAGDSGAPTLDTSNVSYTRAGDFRVNANGYLTTQGGQYVVGTAAAIKIPTDATDVAIATNGQVTYTESGTQKTAGYLQLANFPNDAGLSRAGDSMWTATSASGTPSTGTPSQGGFGTTTAGELEQSNVDMAAEFSNMIDAQNGYEADSKVITTADQMLQALVAMPQG